MNGNYSFVTDKTDPKSLRILKTTTDEKSDEPALVFEILQTSLSANNKFYVDFGDKPPFSFFKCYPVDTDRATLVSDNGDEVAKNLVHPPVWGVCKAVQSKLEDVQVGTHYFAQLPMAETCSFTGGKVNKEDGSLTIERNTNPAYNVFSKIEETDTYLSEELGGLATVCFPGIVTGFGLYYHMKDKDFYGSDNIVLTSASSKVSLALALYLKQENAGKKVIGYTSDSNKEFCEKTGLYDTILGYNDQLPDDNCVMVDVSGKGDIYTNNASKVIKLLCVGNASGSPDAKSTFSSFSPYASTKLILTMAGAPSWMRNWMNPTQELFLIMDISAKLKAEWGITKYKETMESFNKSFCEKAAKEWMSVRSCTTEETIIKAFEDIMAGTVPPTEAIALNVAKAVAGRRKE